MDKTAHDEPMKIMTFHRVQRCKMLLWISELVVHVCAVRQAHSSIDLIGLELTR